MLLALGEVQLNKSVHIFLGINSIAIYYVILVFHLIKRVKRGKEKYKEKEFFLIGFAIFELELSFLFLIKVSFAKIAK